MTKTPTPASLAKLSDFALRRLLAYYDEMHDDRAYRLCEAEAKRRGLL